MFLEGIVYHLERVPIKRSRKHPGGGLGGYPPASIFPQDWGIKGVDKGFFSNLIWGNTEKASIRALLPLVVLSAIFL